MIGIPNSCSGNYQASDFKVSAKFIGNTFTTAIERFIQIGASFYRLQPILESHFDYCKNETRIYNFWTNFLTKFGKLCPLCKPEQAQIRT